MRAERPRIAVIGVGQRGAALARRFHDLGALSVLCDPDDIVLKNLVDNYPDIETTVTPVAVLKNKSIQGVVIATPAHARFDLAREALMAGKHVYAECPPTLHTKEAEALATAACEQNLIFMVGNPVIYNPAFIRLRQVADSGELGRIRYIYSHRLGSCGVYKGEGTFEPFPPQDVSMVLALAGGEPSSVMATGGRYLDGSAIDPVLTQLEFSFGLRAHILVSQNYPCPVRNLIVAGDSRTAVFDDAAPWKDKLTLHVNRVDGTDCIAPTKSAESERVRVPADEPIGAACEHFLHCIHTGNRPVTDGSEWLRVVRVIELGLDSLGGKRGRVLAPFSSDSMAHFTANNPQRDSCKSAHIHPSAIIDDGCKIGAGSRIWHFAHIMSNAQIGEDCSVGQNVIIGQDVKIGKRCKIQNNVSIYKGVTLEESVFCGPSVVFTNVYRPRAELGSIDQARPTLIEKGASIGANATIVCGVTIGRYALVGAGAVINRNVPDFAVVVGNPAKQIGWACVCGEPLTSELECRTCRRMYEPCISGLKEKVPDTAEANHY